MKRRTTASLCCISLLILAALFLWQRHGAPVGETTGAEPPEHAEPRQDGSEAEPLDKFTNIDPGRYAWEPPDGLPEDVELMPLFGEDDTYESMLERGTKIRHAMRRDYERYLIRKYAP